MFPRQWRSVCTFLFVQYRSLHRNDFQPFPTLFNSSLSITSLQSFTPNSTITTSSLPVQSFTPNSTIHHHHNIITMTKNPRPPSRPYRQINHTPPRKALRPRTQANPDHDHHPNSRTNIYSSQIMLLILTFTAIGIHALCPHGSISRAIFGFLECGFFFSLYVAQFNRDMRASEHYREWAGEPLYVFAWMLAALVALVEWCCGV